jgi:hypothetical protein
MAMRLLVVVPSERRRFLRADASFRTTAMLALVTAGAVGTEHGGVSISASLARRIGKHSPI